MNRIQNCQHCYKYYNKSIVKSCPLCREISFSEILLCNLTRNDQTGSDHFECRAFKPNLSLVSGGGTSSQTPCEFDETTMMHDIEKSSKAKWFRAFSSQQTHRRGGDDVVYNLKNHLCLVTRYRTPIFKGSGRHVTHIAEIVKESGRFFEGSVFLLGKGDDHLHLYIDSIPELSIQELVDTISASLVTEILDSLTGDAPSPLFSKEFFIESMDTFEPLDDIPA